MLYDLLCFSYKTIERTSSSTAASETSENDDVEVEIQTTVPQNKVLLTDSKDTTTRAYANIARRTTDTTITTTTTTTNEPTPTPTTTQKQSKDSYKSEFTTELPEITSTFDLDSPTDNFSDFGSTEISPLDSDGPTSLPDVSLNTEPNKIAFSNKRPTFTTRSTTTTEASVANDDQTLSAIKDTTVLNANNKKPLGNTNNDRNNVEVSSAPEFLASVSSPRPFGFSKRTRRPIARYTTTPVSVSADTILTTTNASTPVQNKVSPFESSAINRYPADRLRPLSNLSRGEPTFNDQSSLQKVSGTSSVNDPSHDPIISRPPSSVVQSDVFDDTVSPYFVPELSQNTRNTFSARPSRFRSTTNGEYATATQQSIPARLPYIDEMIESEEKPKTKVQPIRRFRPKFDEASDASAFNNGFETTTKFIERPLRPGIGNDLSSLTAGDFYKNTGQQRRPPSRRVWPSRTSSTTPADIDASDIPNGSSDESKIEVSSRHPLRRKSFITTTESNSDPTVLRKSTSRAFENRHSNLDVGTENFDNTPASPRIKAVLQRRPFLGSNGGVTSSPSSSTLAADIVTIPAEDSELASNYRVYDLQPHHVDNTVLTAGDPVKLTLGHKLNFGSTAINRLDIGRGKQVTTSLDHEFTDSPIIFLNSRRTTVQTLTSVTPLLYPLLALNSIKEDHTEISNEASDLEAVSIDQPTATEINSPLVDQNIVGLLFNSTVEKSDQNTAGHLLNSTVGKSSSDSVTEIYTNTAIIGNMNYTDDNLQPENNVTLPESTVGHRQYKENEDVEKKPAISKYANRFRTNITKNIELDDQVVESEGNQSDEAKYDQNESIVTSKRPVNKFRPKNRDEGGDGDSNISSENKSRARLPSGVRPSDALADGSEESLPNKSLPEVTTTRGRLRRPSFRTPSYTDLSPVTEPLKPIVRGRRPLLRPATSFTDISDDDIDASAVPVVPKFSARERKPFGRRTSSTTEEPSVADEEIIDGLPVSAEVTPRPAVKASLRPFNQRREGVTENRFGTRDRSSYLKRVTSTTEKPYISEEEDDDLTTEESISSEEAAQRQSFRERKPYIKRTSSTTEAVDIVAESDVTTYEPNSEEVNSIRLFTKPIIRADVKGERKPFVQLTSSSKIGTIEELTTTSPDSNEAEEDIDDSFETKPAPKKIVNSVGESEEELATSKPSTLRIRQRSSTTTEVTAELDKEATTVMQSSEELELSLEKGKLITPESVTDLDLEDDRTTVEPNSEEVNIIRLFANPIGRSQLLSENQQKEEANEETGANPTKIPIIREQRPEVNLASNEETATTITDDDNSANDKTQENRSRRPLHRPASIFKDIKEDDDDATVTKPTNLRGRRPLLRTSPENAENSAVTKTIDDASNVPVIRGRRPLLRTSTSPTEISPNSDVDSITPLRSTITPTDSEKASIANNTADAPNRRRKIIRRRKPSAISTSNFEEKKLMGESSSLSTVSPVTDESESINSLEPTRRRKIIRKLVRKPDPSVVSETDIPGDIDITTTNIELLPVRGYFRPPFTSSAEDESAEAARRGKAKGEAASPDRVASRTKPKLLSIQEHINYDSAEDENFLKGPASNDEDNIEDNGSNNQGQEEKNPTSTTAKSIIRPFGSRAPFKPVRPTVDTSENNTRTLSSTPRSYVRKYSSKFASPNQPNVEENVDELPILGSVKPFGAARSNPNRFRNNFQNEDQEEYDDDNLGEDDDEEQNDDEDENDPNFIGVQVKPSYSSVRNGRPSNRPHFTKGDNGEEDILPVPKIKPSIRLSRPKTFVSASRNRDQESNDDSPVEQPDEFEPIRRPTSSGYKPKAPRLRPTLPATTPSSRRQNIPYSGKFSASSAEPPTNQLLDDLDRNALNSRNKKIFEKNSKKHFTLNASTPSHQQQQPQNPDQTNTNIEFESSTDDYNTNTVVTNSYGGEEYSTLSLEQLLDDTIHDNINTINFNELQEATTISTASASKSASAKPTTTQKPTTLHHIFAIDYDEKTEAMPDLKESERNSELITQKLEKIAEVSRIVEISSQQQTHTLNSKTGKSTASNLVIEKLPTVDKLGEISRITLIKLVDYNEQDGRTPTPEVVAARLKEKKSRQLMSPENIFSVETSTIPLEALFDKERAAKQLKDGIVYATSLGETESSVQATSTAAPVFRSSATVDDASYVRPLAPLLRPESNESSPLVISIANLDQVTLSKVPKGSDGDSRESEDDASASSAKVSTVIATNDAVSDKPRPVYVRTESTGPIASHLALDSTSTVMDYKPNKPFSKVSVL